MTAQTQVVSEKEDGIKHYHKIRNQVCRKCHENVQMARKSLLRPKALKWHKHFCEGRESVEDEAEASHDSHFVANETFRVYLAADENATLGADILGT